MARLWKMAAVVLQEYANTVQRACRRILPAVADTSPHVLFVTFKRDTEWHATLRLRARKGACSRRMSALRATAASGFERMITRLNDPHKGWCACDGGCDGDTLLASYSIEIVDEDDDDAWSGNAAGYAVVYGRQAPDSDSGDGSIYSGGDGPDAV